MAKPLPKREKYWREIRRERLPFRGFFAWEARILQRFPMSRSYMRRLIRARQKILMKAIREDWSPEEYRYAVRAEYEARGWFDEGGDASVYKMIKHYRKISIDLGEYTPPPPRRRSPTDWPRWKGDTAKQKLRWRAKHKEEIAASKRRWREKKREEKRGGRVVFRDGRFVIESA